MKISTLLVPFFLLVGSLRASPMDHICDGCKAKYGQVAYDVWEYEDTQEKAIFHMAKYHPHGLVRTWIEGEHKGRQEVYLMGELLTCSITSEIASDYFVHYYPKHRIISYAGFQIIEQIRPFKHGKHD